MQNNRIRLEMYFVVLFIDYFSIQPLEPAWLVLARQFTSHELLSDWLAHNPAHKSGLDEARPTTAAMMIAKMLNNFISRCFPVRFAGLLIFYSLRVFFKSNWYRYLRLRCIYSTLHLRHLRLITRLSVLTQKQNRIWANVCWCSKRRLVWFARVANNGWFIRRFSRNAQLFDAPNNRIFATNYFFWKEWTEFAAKTMINLLTTFPTSG